MTNIDVLVISCGRWDAEASPEAIRSAIDAFTCGLRRTLRAGARPLIRG